MNRVALYVAAVSAALSTWMIFRNRYASGNPHRVPVKKAAEMLQQAWADNHTVA